MRCIIIETLSYIVAIALGLSAVISPIVTTIINNRHQKVLNQQNNELQLKLKYLESSFPLKSLALDNYLNSLSKYLTNPSKQNLSDYKISMTKVHLYVGKNVINAIENIDQAIDSNQFEDINQILSWDLASALYKDAKKNNIYPD